MPKNINKIIRFKNDTRLIVIKERLSERCEICHKADCFDSINNYCSRCTNIIEQLKKDKIPYPFGNGIFEGAIVGACISLIFNPIIALTLYAIAEDNNKPFNIGSITLTLTCGMGLFILIGILSSYISTKYLKLADDEEILRMSRKIIDWSTCIFIGTATGGLVVAFLSVLITLTVPNSDVIEAFFRGLCIGVFCGIANSLINSVLLIYKRNKAFIFSRVNITNSSEST